MKVIVGRMERRFLRIVHQDKKLYVGLNRLKIVAFNNIISLLVNTFCMRSMRRKTKYLIYQNI